MTDVMLTTIDNPYDPFDNWDDWYAYDEAKGYCSSGYVARIAKLSDELSDSEQDSLINDAIDEIVAMNPSGLYKKVQKSDDSSE